MRYLLLLIALPSLAVARGHAPGRYADVLIEGVPHVQQEPDFCGEACAEMWLRKLGHPVSQRAIFDLAGIDPLLGRGAYTSEMARALGRLGFDVGPIYHTVRADRDRKSVV